MLILHNARLSSRIATLLACFSCCAIHNAGADLVVTVGDAVVSRDGTALVEVTAHDDNQGPPLSISSFRLLLEIQNSGSPDRQFIFLDDDTVAMSRQRDDYVFAGKTLFLQEQEISPNGKVLTVTDAIHFLDPASPLGSPKLVTEFNLGLDLSQDLASNDLLSIDILSTSELFDDSGLPIAPTAITFVDGPVRIVAVPEPGLIVPAVFLVGLSQLRRRRWTE